MTDTQPKKKGRPPLTEPYKCQCGYSTNRKSNYLNHTATCKSVAEQTTRQRLFEKDEIIRVLTEQNIALKQEIIKLKKRRRAIGEAERAEICLRQGGKCANPHGKCHLPGGLLMNGCIEIDHIIPKSMGGSCDNANLQAVCSACHSFKTKLDCAEAAAKRRQERGIADKKTEELEPLLKCVVDDHGKTEWKWESL